MRYYLLRQDAREDHWNAAFVDGLPLDALLVGVPVDAPLAAARLTIATADATPSDFLERPCLFVSDAMRRALDDAGVDNVQYFAADVVAQYAEAALVARYWAANVVGAVACAAAGSAELPPVAGPAPAFRVDPARTFGLDLFRLAEDRRLIVVSERAAERLRAAGLRGLVLQPPETFTGRRVRTAAAPAASDEELVWGRDPSDVFGGADG